MVQGKPVYNVLMILATIILMYAIAGVVVSYDLLSLNYILQIVTTFSVIGILFIVFYMSVMEGKTNV